MTAELDERGHFYRDEAGHWLNVDTELLWLVGMLDQEAARLAREGGRDNERSDALFAKAEALRWLLIRHWPEEATP
jgi:hypothetical protein